MVKLMGGKGDVVVQTGVIGMAALDERVRGFRDAIKGTQIKEVAFQANDDSMEKAVELINTYLAGQFRRRWVLRYRRMAVLCASRELPELVKFRTRGGIFGLVDTSIRCFNILTDPIH